MFTTNRFQRGELFLCVFIYSDFAAGCISMLKKYFQHQTFRVFSCSLFEIGSARVSFAGCTRNLKNMFDTIIMLTHGSMLYELYSHYNIILSISKWILCNKFIIAYISGFVRNTQQSILNLFWIAASVYFWKWSTMLHARTSLSCW